MADLSVVRPTGTTALELLVEDYLMACRARGLSRNTIETSYGYPLRRLLLPWCAEHQITEVEHFDRRAADAFAVDLRETPGRRGSPLAATSVHAYLAGRSGLSHLE